MTMEKLEEEAQENKSITQWLCNPPFAHEPLVHLHSALASTMEV